MNKTKKVLSIILITLLILSTVFTLMKKVGLCASSEPLIYVEDFPLPYGNDSGIGWDRSIYTQEDIQIVMNYFISNAGALDDYVLFALDDGSSGYVEFRFQHFTPYGNISFGNNGSIGIDVGSQYYSYGLTYDIANQSCSNFDGAYFHTSFSIPLSFLQPSPTGVGYIVPRDSFIQFYPLAIVGDIEYSGYSLFQGYSDGSYVPDDLVSGSISQFSDTLQAGNEITSSMSDVDKWNSLRGWINNIQGGVLSGFSWLWSNFQSLLKPLFDNQRTFFDFILNPGGFIGSWLSEFFLQHGLGDLIDDWAEDGVIDYDFNNLPADIYSYFSSWFSSFWSNFDNHLEDFIEGIWVDLPDIMKSPYRIAQWFYSHGLLNGEFDFMTLWHYLFDFDSTSALNSFSSNKYGDFVLDVRDFFNTFFGSISNQNASSRVFFVIPIGSHFGSDVGDIEINFDWYSSIRDNYLPYFMAFLYVSIIWLFFKRLPDILRGVAGAESSFTDAIPYDTHSTTYNRDGVFTSTTHVSNGGRTKVTYNSYKKL